MLLKPDVRSPVCNHCSSNYWFRYTHQFFSVIKLRVTCWVRSHSIGFCSWRTSFSAYWLFSLFFSCEIRVLKYRVFKNFRRSITEVKEFWAIQCSVNFSKSFKVPFCFRKVKCVWSQPRVESKLFPQILESSLLWIFINLVLPVSTSLLIENCLTLFTSILRVLSFQAILIKGKKFPKFTSQSSNQKVLRNKSQYHCSASGLKCCGKNFARN